MRNIINMKILFIVSMLTMILMIGAACAAPGISVVPSTNIVKPGDNITLNIDVDPDGNSVYAGNFVLLFNPAMLSVNPFFGSNAFSPGGFLTQDGAGTANIFNYFDNINGRAGYAQTRLSAKNGVTTPGTIASISLHVKETATPGMLSILNLTLVQIAEPSSSLLDIIINNGSSTIEYPVLTIVLSGSPTTTLTVGDNHPFTAIVRDQNNNLMDGIDLTWTVSNASVGDVNPTKTITVTGSATSVFNVKAAGTTMIKATNGSVNGTASVTVNPPSEKLTGSISGFKINDENGNGKWNAGEKGISDWNIKLIILSKHGKIILKETHTNALGFYEFDNLTAGKYIVKEEKQNGWRHTSPDIRKILLKYGQKSMNNNFTNMLLKKGHSKDTDQEDCEED